MQISQKKSQFVIHMYYNSILYESLILIYIYTLTVKKMVVLIIHQQRQAVRIIINLIFHVSHFSFIAFKNAALLLALYPIPSHNRPGALLVSPSMTSNPRSLICLWKTENKAALKTGLLWQLSTQAVKSFLLGMMMDLELFSYLMKQKNLLDFKT